jgi:MFS transporter, DHA2 family, multidrug resistance protein
VNAGSFAIDPDLRGLAGSRRVWAISAVLTAMVMVVLDAAIANIALPTIGQSLRVTPAMAVRVMTAYQLGLVLMLLPAAALGESLGFRKVFFTGSALFAAASALCALSPSLPWLTAARFVQGIGGAAIMALGVALLRFVVSQDQLGRAIGWNALTVALASAAGPVIGATILSIAPWPWLFAINLPIGAAVLLATRALPFVKGSDRPVDLASIGLNAVAFTLFVVGAEVMPAAPAFAALILTAAAVSAIALVRREAGREAPLIPLDLLARNPFRVSVIASILCFMGQGAGLLALPFHLQHTLGLSALMTGAYMTPWPLTVALAGPLAGKLVRRVSTSWLCLAGGMFLTVGLCSAALWPLDLEPGALLISTMLCGLGFGLFNVPNNHNMFLSAPRERSAAAGGLQGVARLTGQTGGAVIMTLLFELSSRNVAPRIGLTLAAFLTFAAGIASLARTSVDSGSNRTRGHRSPDSSKRGLCHVNRQNRSCKYPISVLAGGLRPPGFKCDRASSV